jgi:hypothetical protein
MSAATGPLLEYSPRSKRSRSRKVAGRIVLVLAIFAFAGAIWRWGPREWKHLGEYRLQRQCMAYSGPPQQVVYEEDPERAERLLAGQSAYHRGRSHQTDTPVAMHVPPWMSSTLDWRTGREALLFMHERSTPGGKRRLVRVWCDPVWDPAESMPGYFHWEVEQPLSRSAWAAKDVDIQEILHGLNGIPSHRMSPWPARVRRVRLYAGQVDPSDPSHFTIAYAIDDLRGTIDGWLHDEPIRFATTDSQVGSKSIAAVRFNVRDGPAVRAVP